MAKEFTEIIEGAEGIERLELLMVAMNVVLGGHNEILLNLEERIRKLEREAEKK